jgi:carboxyl-terminal processing protease
LSFKTQGENIIMSFIRKSAWIIATVFVLTNCSSEKSPTAVGGKALASKSYIDTQIQLLSADGTVVNTINPQEPPAVTKKAETADEARVNQAWTNTGLTPTILFKVLMPTPICTLSFREYLGCFRVARLVSEKIYGDNTILGVNGLGSEDMVGEPTVVMNYFTVYKKMKIDFKSKDKTEISEFNKKIAGVEQKNLDKVKALYENSIQNDPVAQQSREMFKQRLPEFFASRKKATSMADIEKLNPNKIQDDYDALEISANHQITSDFGRLFSDAFKDIEPSAYAKRVADIYNTFMSMASDGHAALHLTQQAQQALAQTSEKQHFFGIGTKVSLVEGHIYFSPLLGGPAILAGVEDNDELISVNGVNVTGDQAGLEAAVAAIKGEQNTEVTIVVKKWGKEDEVSYLINRQPVQNRTVKYSTTKSGEHIYGVLTVEEFTSEVYDLASEIVKSHDSEIEGWVLDLRNDPGGLVDQAVGLSSVFVKKGSPVVGRSLIDNEDVLDPTSLIPTYTDQLTVKKLVVLINGGSASASEIVSGYLQEVQRADLVIGETSFGKGSMQGISSEHYNIKNFDVWASAPFGQPTPESMVKRGYPRVSNPRVQFMRTISRYFYPSGRTPEWSGVEPDIQVTYAPGAEPIFKEREKDNNPYSFASAGAPWVQPRQEYVNKVKVCVETQGQRSKGWDLNKAGPYDDYQMRYAADALACIQ